MEIEQNVNSGWQNGFEKHLSRILAMAFTEI
jgi:hypothetical protein